MTSKEGGFDVVGEWICGVTFTSETREYKCDRPRDHAKHKLGPGHSQRGDKGGIICAWGPGIEGSSDFGLVPTVRLPGQEVVKPSLPVVAEQTAARAVQVDTTVSTSRRRAESYARLVALSAIEIPISNINSWRAAIYDGTNACLVLNSIAHIARFEALVCVAVKADEFESSRRLSGLTKLGALFRSIAESMIARWYAGKQVHWESGVLFPMCAALKRIDRTRDKFEYEEFFDELGGLNAVLEMMVDRCADVFSRTQSAIADGTLTITVRAESDLPVRVPVGTWQRRLSGILFDVMQELEATPAVEHFLSGPMFSGCSSEVVTWYWRRVAEYLWASVHHVFFQSSRWVNDVTKLRGVVEKEVWWAFSEITDHPIVRYVYNQHDHVWNVQHLFVQVVAGLLTSRLQSFVGVLDAEALSEIDGSQELPFQVESGALRFDGVVVAEEVAFRAASLAICKKFQLPTTYLKLIACVQALFDNVREGCHRFFDQSWDLSELTDASLCATFQGFVPTSHPLVPSYVWESFSWLMADVSEMAVVALRAMYEGTYVMPSELPVRAERLISSLHGLALVERHREFVANLPSVPDDFWSNFGGKVAFPTPSSKSPMEIENKLSTAVGTAGGAIASGLIGKQDSMGASRFFEQREMLDVDKRMEDQFQQALTSRERALLKMLRFRQAYGIDLVRARKALCVTDEEIQALEARILRELEELGKEDGLEKAIGDFVQSGTTSGRTSSKSVTQSDDVAELRAEMARVHQEMGLTGPLGVEGPTGCVSITGPTGATGSIEDVERLVGRFGEERKRQERENAEKIIQDEFLAAMTALGVPAEQEPVGGWTVASIFSVGVVVGARVAHVADVSLDDVLSKIRGFIEELRAAEGLIRSERVVEPSITPVENARATSFLSDVIENLQGVSDTQVFVEMSVASKGEKTMAEEKKSETQAVGRVEPASLVKTLQADAVEAAYRTAASQFIKLTREPLVALLSRHLGPEDPSIRAKIARFLETEIGTAFLASLLAVGVGALPHGTSHQIAEVAGIMARQLRIRAMSDMGDLVAEVLMGPLRQVMSDYLRDVVPGLPGAVPPALEEARPPIVRLADFVPSTSDKVAGSEGT